MSISYNIDSIENGIAKVSYSDGSWAEIVLASDMTAEQVDDLAYQYAPKSGTAPSFLTTGARTAAAMPVEQVDAPPLEDAWVDPRPQYVQDRAAAYGSLEEQIEYITENGLTAWQTKVAQIKADNPKPADD